MKRLQWVGCWFAYHAYLKLPFKHDHSTRYGRFKLWLLGFAGAYAHSDNFADFCEHVRFDRA